MIERLLEADRLLALGLNDQAERIYWQAVELDPQNTIAVVGLARVALEKGDDRTALQFAHKALEMDPENPAAQRLVARLEEVIAYRDGTVPPPRPAGLTAVPEAPAREAPAPEAPAPETPAVRAATGATEATEAAGAPAPEKAPADGSPTHPPAGHGRRGLWRRLLGGR
jgi:tetratricopeptide (TPR) repeat protein